MQIELFKGEQQESDPELLDLELMTVFKIHGISALKDNHIAKKEGSTKPKVGLSFEMTRSGFVTLNKVEAKIEELVTYNETIKVPKIVIETEEISAED